jgi:alpha-L-arabinofuranosidase
MKLKSALTMALCLSMVSVCLAQEVTTVRITDKVLLEGTKRFGLNIGGRGARLQKKRIRINFEGSIHRRCVLAGPECTKDTITSFLMDKAWVELINSKGGGTFTILSGPQMGVTGRIVSAEFVKKRGKWHGNDAKLTDLYAFKLEKPLAAPLAWRDGIRLEVKHIKDGALIGSESYPNKIGKFSDDVSPETWGFTSLEFGPEGKRGIWLRVGSLPRAPKKPVLACSFWAKSVGAPATFTLSRQGAKGVPPLKTVQIGKEWKRYEFDLDMTGVSKIMLAIQTSALARLDDISIDVKGYENPTPFDDGTYEIFKGINPSNVRCLQTSGGDVENFLRPKLQRYAASKMGASAGGRYPYDNSDYYAFCKELKMEPWYNLPGTITKEGVLKYMEYIGAPKDVGLGKLRAESGHPEPWTETLKAIHVEFGNEIWNLAPPYVGCGFSGPDHWEAIIKAAKESPYYKPNVIFHVGGRGFSAGGPPTPTWKSVPEHVPSADRYTWAPYILHKLSKKDIATLGSDENLVKYAFTRAIDNATNLGGGRGEMFRAQQGLKKAGVSGSLSIYEVNHHLCFSNEDARERNIIMATLAGGVNVANAMLMHVKYNGAIDQSFFTYGANGGTFEKSVYKWSTHYVNADGSVRYNPQMTAIAALNKVLGGDLLETVHEGPQPVFSSFTYMRFKPIDNLPALWSYAFKDEDKRSLVLVNLDLLKPLTVQVEHKDAGENAVQRTVTAEKFSDHNIVEQKVRTVEKKLGVFKTGSSVEIPACSILTLSWE